MLNEALRLIRIFHDMTQKDLAARLKIVPSYLCEIEAGKKEPTMHLAPEILRGVQYTYVVYPVLLRNTWVTVRRSAGLRPPFPERYWHC